jgi:hypothetical protein
MRGGGGCPWSVDATYSNTQYCQYMRTLLCSIHTSQYNVYNTISYNQHRIPQVLLNIYHEFIAIIVCKSTSDLKVPTTANSKLHSVTNVDFKGAIKQIKPPLLFQVTYMSLLCPSNWCRICNRSSFTIDI